jgi:hypothetical protein
MIVNAIAISFTLVMGVWIWWSGFKAGKTCAEVSALKENTKAVVEETTVEEAKLAVLNEELRILKEWRGHDG